MRLSTVIGATLVLILAGSPARADEVRALRYDTRIDIAVTSIGGVWWLTSELLKGQLVPEKCRWCYRAEDGSDLLNPYDGWVRRKLIWKNTEAAATASSVIDYFLLPASMLGLSALAAGHDNATRAAPIDALIITEATIIAADINQVAKFAFARERPFVHYLPRAPKEVRALTGSPSDDNLSFFSGHTTLAFALATSAGTVTTMRGYQLAPLVWASGLTMAVSVGYLRIAADRHYLSDVMTGAVVGAIVGVGIPLLFHSPVSSPDASPPSASGQALSGPPVRSAFSMSGAF